MSAHFYEYATCSTCIKARKWLEAQKSYRALGLGTKLAALSDEEKISLLAKDGKLIKGPIFVQGSTVLVGFREEDYEKFAK
jgi:arsenate reductase